jgi:hypothetical protein
VAVLDRADHRRLRPRPALTHRGPLAGGEPFRPDHIRSIHADGDTVIDGTAFYDSISFNDLWTRVGPAAGGASATG